MTVSTPLFDLIADRKRFKEERLAKIQHNYERAENKIAKQLDRPYSCERQEKISFLRGINSARSYRIPAIQESIEWLDGLLPKDEFSLEIELKTDDVTGEVDFLIVNYEITDSPYDDTFTGGEQIAFTTVGKRSRGSWTSTKQTNQVAEVDGVTTGKLGSSSMARQYNEYDSFTANIWNKFPQAGEDAVIICSETIYR